MITLEAAHIQKVTTKSIADWDLVDLMSIGF